MIVDVGCGDGTATGMVRRLGHPVVGVDWPMMAPRQAKRHDLLLIRGEVDRAPRSLDQLPRRWSSAGGILLVQARHVIAGPATDPP